MVMAAHPHDLERKPHADEKPLVSRMLVVSMEVGSYPSRSTTIIAFLDFAVAVCDINYLLNIFIALLITIPQ